jgi:hypothetical protein
MTARGWVLIEWYAMYFPDAIDGNILHVGHAGAMTSAAVFTFLYVRARVDGCKDSVAIYRREEEVTTGVEEVPGEDNELERDVERDWFLHERI